MILKEDIEKIVADFIAGTDMFIVDVIVSASNVIQISIDSFSGIDIDACVQLSKCIEQHFDREVEDYELEVSSAGISLPFKVFQQYQKNIGKEVTVLLKDGKKLTGTLIYARPDAIQLAYTMMEKIGAKGKKKEVSKEEEFSLEAIKQTTLVITVK